jgi:hypothetical protein
MIPVAPFLRADRFLDISRTAADLLPFFPPAEKKVNVATNLWGFLSAGFMGVLSIVFLEQETKSDCEKNLNKFFLGVGITELICAALYVYLIIVFLVTKADAARAKSLMGGPSICLCYGGITLLVFLILGSVWVWSSDGDECVCCFPTHPLCVCVCLFIFWLMVPGCCKGVTGFVFPAGV